MTATAASTMRAIVQRGYGTPTDVLHLEEVQRPEPEPDEVLVRVHASSVNTPDWLTVTGRPWVLRLQGGLRRPRTLIRGTDLAGVVVQVGRDVTDLAPGDEVFGSAWANGLVTPGAFCEYAVAPASSLAPRPASLSWAEAAASVMSGITALVGIRDAARVRPGTTVLVNGASGGVGTFMVQLAAVRGAEVTGVCSGRNAELVRSLGAAHVVDHTEQHVTDLPTRYDVVIDNVLNHSGPAMARLLAPGGRLVPNSVGQGSAAGMGLPRIARTMVLGALGRLELATITCVVDRRNLTELASLLEAGEARVVLDGTYPLAEAPHAVAHMASHRARGNIAITIP